MKREVPFLKKFGQVIFLYGNNKVCKLETDIFSDCFKHTQTLRMLSLITTCIFGLGSKQILFYLCM